MQLTAVNYFQSFLLQQSLDDVIITLKTIQKLTCCSDSSVGTVITVHPEKRRYFLSIPDMSSKCFYSPDLPDRHWSPAIINAVLFRKAYSCCTVMLITPQSSIENKHQQRCSYSHPYAFIQCKQTTLHLFYLHFCTHRTSAYIQSLES